MVHQHRSRRRRRSGHCLTTPGQRQRHRHSGTVQGSRRVVRSHRAGGDDGADRQTHRPSVRLHRSHQVAQKALAQRRRHRNFEAVQRPLRVVRSHRAGGDDGADGAATGRHIGSALSHVVIRWHHRHWRRARGAGTPGQSGMSEGGPKSSCWRGRWSRRRSIW